MGLWPKVSVIIPFGGKSDYIEETLRYLSRVEYPDYEVILLPDKPFSSGDDVKVVPTGPVGPAAKRDMALAYAEGEILAFLDDDAYPERDWLKNAVKYFEDPEVAAIGGPAVTPPNDGLLQKASGYVYPSLLGGGHYAYRYIPQKMREIDDYPICNLFVRKLFLEQLGGFDTSFWPGEDTKFCLVKERLQETRDEVRETRREINERFDQMYDRMLVQSRWLVGSIALFSTVMSVLLAIGQFVK